MPGRIFVRKDYDKKLSINGNQYEIYNISIKGVGFLTGHKLFDVGDKISMSLANIDISGIIIHATTIKKDGNKYFLNGVKYISVGDIDALLTLILSLED